MPHGAGSSGGGRGTRSGSTTATPVVWARQELFQQRVCPAIDVDLAAARKLVAHLRRGARMDEWELFTLDAWIAGCRDVLNLAEASARRLFQGFKIMEAWSAYDLEFPADTVAAAAADGGQAADRVGSLPLMAQFLFVRNYTLPPEATAADVKLQVESVYPTAAAAAAAAAAVGGGVGGGGSPRGSPRSAASKSKAVAGGSKAHSWSSMMKLRQSSADQHYKYVVTNLKALLRLVVRDLATAGGGGPDGGQKETEDAEGRFAKASMTAQELHHFGFLFGGCIEQHPEDDSRFADLVRETLLGAAAARTTQGKAAAAAAAGRGSGPRVNVADFEAWVKRHLVSIPYGEDHEHPHGMGGPRSASSSPTNAGSGSSAGGGGDVPPRVSPLVAASGRPLYIGRKSDASVLVDERHFPSAHHGHGHGHGHGRDQQRGHGVGAGAGSTHPVHGRSVTVLQCTHSSVFIVAPVAFLRIVGCSHCSIFVSAARFNVTVENCDHCTVTATTRSVAVCNCVDTTLHMCTTSPPVLTGDCRGIRLAPNGSFHHRDLPLLAQARFPGTSNQRQSPGSQQGRDDDGGAAAATRNMWDQPVEDDSKAHGTGADHVVAAGPGASKAKGANWSLLPPDDFVPALVPYYDSAGGGRHHAAAAQDPRLYPAWRRLPPAYAAVGPARAARAAALQRSIEASGCTVEQMADLQTFVENEFMEWLHAEGHSIALHNWVKNLKKRK